MLFEFQPVMDPSVTDHSEYDVTLTEMHIKRMVHCYTLEFKMSVHQKPAIRTDRTTDGRTDGRTETAQTSKLK